MALSNQKILKIAGESVPVEAADDIDLDAAVGAQPFIDWVNLVESERRFVVEKITIQSLDKFGSRVGFVKFKAAVKVDGKDVPGIVFMRGGSVGVLVLLDCQGELYTVLVHQPRVAVGKGALAEIPAGMLDGEGNFAGVAAKELKEETGIIIKECELYDMTQAAYGARFPGVYPSCGASDEFNRLFVFRKAISKEQLDELQGKLTGNMEEGEYIKLSIIPYNDLWMSSPDAKALCAGHLYEKLFPRKSLPSSSGVSWAQTRRWLCALVLVALVVAIAGNAMESFGWQVRPMLLVTWALFAIILWASFVAVAGVVAFWKDQTSISELRYRKFSVSHNPSLCSRALV